MEIISAQQFIEEAQNAQEKFYILDVRSEAEFKKSRIADIPSDNVPLDEVPDVVDTIVNHCQNLRTYVLCKAGKRAQFAAYDLEQAGATNVAVIEGGTMALEALDVNMQADVISIDRQYHILMGSFVLVGLLYGHYFDVAYFALAALASVSLLLHGVTGKCGIRQIVKKMRWNAYASLDLQEEITKSVNSYQQKKADLAGN